MKCHGYLLCESIDITLIKSEAKYRQVAVLRHEGSTCFVFPYGAFIIWGTGDLFHFESLVGSHMKTKFLYEERLVDEFEVRPTELLKLIHEDIIYLTDHNLEIMFSISHAIAQSLRLSHIEDDVLRLMNVNRQVPLDLAQTGKVKKSKKEISKLQGELYLKKTKMSFEYSILDKPEFFWVYPEFDSFYTKTIEYLELHPRIEILSKKIQTIDEILAILSNELNHRHSSRLEWIIIILILIEIVIFFLQDVFKII
jgi:uncharacterized Rmd1/YagE family protein